MLEFMNIILLLFLLSFNTVCPPINFGHYILTSTIFFAGRYFSFSLFCLWTMGIGWEERMLGELITRIVLFCFPCFSWFVYIIRPRDLDNRNETAVTKTRGCGSIVFIRANFLQHFGSFSWYRMILCTSS